MGRGRGKGKKQNVIALREDPGSDEEEKVPASKRRGRPQKPLEDGIEEQEEEVEKVDKDEDDVKIPISGKDMKFPAAIEKGRKRKRSMPIKKNVAKEENGIGSKSSANDSPKSLGFRQNGSRRKNKPRRAAEAGVKCK
ncbi:uncharacterized protein LOC110811671 [Carica papaya]|uniref:uncharacterized protein LOC110811671 n=1 Tax=Carica papaya TaxID=3649 RepID=UPI000B8CBA16|nr:uncharacterized protein LOC110811671 [Carica papaya]